ncbi:hypothetical protein RhiirC2_717505 [Rhizophagus irregularis]|uniref:Uncharacterized protein n=1 Tax=Rhizophagus irregularis TaxID=588596 RepID=A0A2N1MM35_9GLOM|nr:hypothetical protein RhiirC2_717505 [Rhizophagus irregularis]
MFSGWMGSYSFQKGSQHVCPRLVEKEVESSQLQVYPLRVQLNGSCGLPLPLRTRNNQSVQKAPYVRSPRTRKHIPCHCQNCKGKLVDPRTKKSHDSRSTNRIIPQRSDRNRLDD